MSPSPASGSDKAAVARYGRSWGELMAAVRSGVSWSGSERNKCFLNLAGERFADASFVSGLGFNDDGRAMAFCDWDRDGDLDLWLRNRTAPRLRLMINRGGDGRAIWLKLEGASCNRDAVGAVVEMRTGASVLVRSVRAGEMFLSQSSKWLGFGLGDAGVAGGTREVSVRWPGGGLERFAGLEVGRRYHLKQGQGVARAEPVSPALEMGDARIWAGSAPTRGARIRMPVPVPIPEIRYRDPAAKAKLLEGGRPMLLTLWEGACAPSEAELKTLQAGSGQLAAAGIGVMALAINGIETAGDAYGSIEGCGFGTPWGFLDAQSLAVLWRWQAALFDRTPAAAVPLSLLLDRGGRCVAIYRGLVGVEALLEDAAELLEVDPVTRWHLAPPLAGTWFTNPPDPRFVRAVVGEALRGSE